MELLHQSRKKWELIFARLLNRMNLKDYVLPSAFHIGRHGPKDLRQDYKRRQAQNQNAEFEMARRFLRLAMNLLRTSQIYLPPDLRSHQADLKTRAAHYLSVWPGIREKWHRLGILKDAFAKERPLGQWRQIIQGLYDIELEYRCKIG